MNLLDAYTQAVNEESDPAERDEFSSDKELKTLVLEEIFGAMKEIKRTKSPTRTTVEAVAPLFQCVAFWFIIGIRVGKILRDAELNKQDQIVSNPVPVAPFPANHESYSDNHTG